MNEDVKECAKKISGNRAKKATNSNEQIENSEPVEHFKNLTCYQRYNLERYNDIIDGIEINSIRNVGGGGKKEDMSGMRKTTTTSSSQSGGECKRKSCYEKAMYNVSSSEDDDEYCVYTYKGSEISSDLPESFYNLGVDIANERSAATTSTAAAAAAGGGSAASVCSSPDMDYLEMDFDPGPSNEQDSDNDNLLSINPHAFAECSKSVMPPPPSPPPPPAPPPPPPTLLYDKNANYRAKITVNNLKYSGCAATGKQLDEPCCSKSLIINSQNVTNYSDEKESQKVKEEEKEKEEEEEDDDDDDNVDDEQIVRCKSDYNMKHRSNALLSRKNKRQTNAFVSVCNTEEANRIAYIREYDSCLWHPFGMENSLVYLEDLLSIDPTSSINTIENLMTALRIPHDNYDLLVDLLLQKKAKRTQFVEYLFQQSDRNPHHTDLAYFLSLCTDVDVYSRFFATYPTRQINFLEWISTWMKKGAVPVITRHLHQDGNSRWTDDDESILTIYPWKHSILYKIAAPLIYLASPKEYIPAHLLQSQLCQPSVDYVRRDSIIRRWNSNVDLRAVFKSDDIRWSDENVIGQVANIIREDNNGIRSIEYVRIPSFCHCGVTLFALAQNTELCQQIIEAPELPLAIY